jgi:hypothetical protein
MMASAASTRELDFLEISKHFREGRVMVKQQIFEQRQFFSTEI